MTRKCTKDDVLLDVSEIVKEYNKVFSRCAIGRMVEIGQLKEVKIAGKRYYYKSHLDKILEGEYAQKPIKKSFDEIDELAKSFTPIFHNKPQRKTRFVQ